MNTTITHRVARYIVMPAVSVGIIGGAALGLAGLGQRRRGRAAARHRGRAADQGAAGH